MGYSIGCQNRHPGQIGRLVIFELGIWKHVIQAIIIVLLSEHCIVSDLDTLKHNDYIKMDFEEEKRIFGQLKPIKGIVFRILK